MCEPGSPAGRGQGAGGSRQDHPAKPIADLRVARLAADADGVAVAPDGKPLYLPFTLPGEHVRPGPLVKRGDAWTATAEILIPSPDRVAPPCPHFGACGGCTLQHWADTPYADWKRARAEAAAGVPIPTIARTPPGARRRIDLAIARANGRLLLGLHRMRSTEIVDMHVCPILHPTLFALVQSARPVLARLAGLRRAGALQMNLLDTGAELLLTTDASLTAADRAALAAWAERSSIPRISWRRGAGPSEPAATLRPSLLAFSGRPTPIPPGAFLQASAEGERAIVDAVRAALPGKRKGRIIELFAGCGSLTHALAEQAQVTAYEGDEAACAALRKAGNPRVSVLHRDLARQPIRPEELKGAAAIVLDPPYAGALAQMPALAQSGLPIIYVSCNPAALARDAQTLTKAGYQPRFAAAIDQFLWSAGVETVVGFAR